MNNTLIKVAKVFVLAGCLGIATLATAAVPDGIDYQGYLTNSDGSAVDGDVSIAFAAYNVDIGGVPLWSDSQTVTVDQGLLSVTLGNPVNPFPTNLFNGPVYIGLFVAGEQLLPRRPLTSAAYSFKAGDADTLTGVTAASLDQSAHTSDTSNPHNVTAAQSGAASAADIASLQSQLNAALASITTLQTDLATANGTIASLHTEVSGNSAAVSANGSAITAVQADVSVIQGNSVLALDNVLTLSGGNTALFTGVNVQVVSGTGATDGDPNGTGNLIVGYDEVSTSDPTCSLGNITSQPSCESAGGVWASSHKIGSHNVVVGREHNYTRYGGLVAGINNSITGNNSTVGGGGGNNASGHESSVSGGSGNTASANQSSVSGGRGNTARGIIASSVSGGFGNIASGRWSSVSGGQGNEATNDYSSVTGGGSNRATGTRSTVSGGSDNTASGARSSVSGGSENAAGFRSSVSGGSGNVASGLNSSISGGQNNTVTGDYSSISGGNSNSATSSWSSVSGGQGNDATGEYSSVSGGINNIAGGKWSSTSGGANRNSTGEADWRAGTLFENF